MVWFFIDDSFEAHPKVRSIPRAKRLRAVGLWTTAGSWSARYLTDGRIPAELVDDWSATSSDVDALLLAGLWERAGDDFQFHDWADWNKTKEEVSQSREAKRRAGRSGGLRSGQVRGSRSEAGASAEAKQVLQQNEPPWFDGGEPPSLPIPTLEEPSPERDDVERLCQQLANAIEANGVRRPTVAKRWRDSARLLLDKDGYTEAQVSFLIEHATKDEFWRANILSMPTLREQSDRLKLKFAPQGVGAIRTLPSGEVDPASLPPVEESWMHRRRT